MTGVVLPTFLYSTENYLMYIAQYHPDVNKQEGAEEKFKEVSNAYEVLASKFYLRYV